VLLAFALRCSVDCRACRISIPLNGFVSSARCYHCGEQNDFPSTFWPCALQIDYLYEALAMAAGERRKSAHLESGTHVEYGHGPIVCTHCKSGQIEPSTIAASVARGECACRQCGASVRARAADATCFSIHPTARFVVGECAPDGAGQALQAKTKPVVFQCMSCGGALQVDGSKRLVACQYCSNENYLPDGLWQLLNPVPKPELFYLVCEVESIDERRARASNTALSPAELASLAVEQDEWVRHAVAQNPATPPAVLKKLAFDPSRRVLEGLAQNPRLPDELVAQMAASDDAEFRAFAAYNPRLSHERLRELADDSNPRVAQAARTRIGVLRAQGIELAPKGFFAKLFG